MTARELVAFAAAWALIGVACGWVLGYAHALLIGWSRRRR